MIFYNGVLLNKRMKRLGIIQARMGSSRLLNKMLLILHGHSIIEWVIKRTTKSCLLDDLVVAIPDTPENDVLEVEILKFGVKVFRGDENDVLSRFYFAAKENNKMAIIFILFPFANKNFNFLMFIVFFFVFASILPINELLEYTFVLMCYLGSTAELSTGTQKC